MSVNDTHCNSLVKVSRDVIFICERCTESFLMHDHTPVNLLHNCSCDITLVMILLALN